MGGSGKVRGGILGVGDTMWNLFGRHFGSMLVDFEEKTQQIFEETEAHELTHTPYRAWCKMCVQGRGLASPHVQKSPQAINNASYTKVS